MTDDILRSENGVTLVGAGHPSVADIEEALTHAPYLVAADGGADFCLEAGLAPHAVIGDFDSASQEVSQKLGSLRRIEVAEQETTDFEKSLSRISAPYVIATGVTAGRIDHTLAALSVLSRRVGPPTLVLANNEVIFAASRTVEINLNEGTRISLFPFEATQGRSSGLNWPIEGLVLHPRGRIGTSNVATGPVSLEFDRAGCLILMPREVLPAALAAVTRG